MRVDVGGGLALDVFTGGLIVLRSVTLDGNGVECGDSIPILPEDLARLRSALAEVAQQPEVRALAGALAEASR